MTSRDSRLMRRAYRLALRARPSPNPRVGAVIARGGEIVGEGWHHRAGEPHAEVEALRDAGDLARGATAYVTLEPCNHVGRTPPCTKALIAAGIHRVVIGSLDPNPLVNGRGVRALRRAGVKVEFETTRVGDACRNLVREWGVFITTGLPFVRLKAALSLDGRMACASGDSKWITGERARREAHRMRDRADAVLVGLGTVQADDPSLTVRHVRPTGPPPLRVVLDPHLEMTGDETVIRTAGGTPTLVVHAKGDPRRLVRSSGGHLETLRCRGRGHALDLGHLLDLLAGRGVTSLLVEGGGQVHTAFLDAGLADAVSVFLAPVLIGGAEAPCLWAGSGSPDMDGALRLVHPEIRRLGPDVLVEGGLKPPG